MKGHYISRKLITFLKVAPTRPVLRFHHQISKKVTFDKNMNNESRRHRDTLYI